MYNKDLADMRELVNCATEALEEKIDSLNLFDKESSMKIMQDVFGIALSCVERGDVDIIQYMNEKEREKKERDIYYRFIRANSI